MPADTAEGPADKSDGATDRDIGKSNLLGRWGSHAWESLSKRINTPDALRLLRSLLSALS